jgi:multidrug efflux pump subunit AcrA (membrane-fusion protein)
VGQVLEFTTDGYPGRVFTGRVMFINPTVDEVNRAGRVTADVVNANHELKGGLFVNGRIIVDTKKGAVHVSSDALQNWNVAKGTADVFVITGDKADRRTVTTGIVTGGVAQITSGVAAGDRVVTRGAFALRPGDRVIVAAAR